jgi:hypothetical protein
MPIGLSILGDRLITMGDQASNEGSASMQALQRTFDRLKAQLDFVHVFAVTTGNILVHYLFTRRD